MPIFKGRHRKFLHLVLSGKLNPTVGFFIDITLGTWYLSSQCNVSCGFGMEIWRRTCDNLSLKSGRQSCAMSRKKIRYQICKRQPCPSMSMHKIFYGNKLKF